MNEIKLSSEIPDDEPVIRAVRSPWVMNKSGTKPTKRAFYPPPTLDEVSVLRLAIGADECIQKAKEITTSDTSTCGGILEGASGEVRSLGLTVEDQREGFFIGHAGIVFTPIATEPRNREKGESLPPEARDELSRLATSLLEKFTFVSEPVARKGRIVRGHEEARSPTS